MNPDKLACMSVKTAQAAAFRTLKGIQNLPAEQQAAGVAMLFSLVMRRFKVDPRVALEQAGRRIDDALKDPQLRAIKQYLGEELA